jgi:molybdate transport system regulatory protein
MPLSLRIDLPSGRLGPGKVELLEHIARAGSLAAAARAMGMSYKRAWELLSALNAMFEEPVALTLPGNNVGGGTLLTPFGERVIALYRAAERRAQQASSAAVAELGAAAVRQSTAETRPATKPATASRRSPRKAAS